MSNVQQDPKEQALFDLADRISQGCCEIEGANRDALAIAIKVGEDLIEARRRLGHGKWGTWVLKNCQLRLRTAQNYMMLGESAAILNASSSTHLNSIDAALKFLRAHKGTTQKKTRQSARASETAPTNDIAHSSLERKVLGSIKMALSLAGGGNGNDVEIATAMRAINCLLTANKLDLHDIEIKVTPKARTRRRAA
jgi:Protein of unknown function (DUF3102)